MCLGQIKYIVLHTWCHIMKKYVVTLVSFFEKLKGRPYNKNIIGNPGGGVTSALPTN